MKLSPRDTQNPDGPHDVGRRRSRLNPTEGERSAVGRAAATVNGTDAIERLLPEPGSGRDALLPLLHAVQAEHGYIDDAMVPGIAAALNLSRADVHGVVTFYHDFRRTAPGRRMVRICRAESCRARGAMAVERALVEQTGTPVGTTVAEVTVDRVHCFGLCASGPIIEIDGRLHARVDPAVVGSLLGGVAA